MFFEILNKNSVKLMSEEEQVKRKPQVAGEIVFQRHDPKTGKDVDDAFDVVVDKKSWVIFIALYVVLVVLQFLHFYEDPMDPNIPLEDGGATFWWVSIVFIPMTVVALLLWGFIGPKFAEGTILKWLGRVKDKKLQKPTDFAFGFPRTKDLYYIEANPNDVNLTNGFVGFKVFIMRVQEVLFLSIGIQTFLAQTLAPFFQNYLEAWDFYGINDMMIDSTIYMGPFALFLLCWVIPLIWMGEDMQIYRINEYQDSVKLGTYLRASIISKVLGFFGIILLFNISQAYAEEVMAYEPEYAALLLNPSTPEYFMAYYGIVIETFIRVLLTCAAPPTLVTLLYLSIFHEKWVNNVRIKASDFLPVGTFRILTVGDDELDHLGHPEKIELQESFFTSKAGIAVMLALAAVTIGIIYYLAFVILPP